MTEFLFDISLMASIRLNAKNQTEARALLAQTLDCADTNFGALPDGTPLTAEVSITESEPRLIEVDGKPVIKEG